MGLLFSSMSSTLFELGRLILFFWSFLCLYFSIPCLCYGFDVFLFFHHFRRKSHHRHCLFLVSYASPPRLSRGTRWLEDLGRHSGNFTWKGKGPFCLEGETDCVMMVEGNKAFTEGKKVDQFETSASVGFCMNASSD